MRGEQKNVRRDGKNYAGSPPLARGTVAVVNGKFDNARITPACAGNSMSTLSRPHIGRDHPRLRGEQFKTAALSGSPLGSPPLARGTVWSASTMYGLLRITPACAGNRHFQMARKQRLKDHPRLRGEQVKRKEGRSKMEGSPPLARGTEMRGHFGAESMGITPACAGNSPLCRPRSCARRDHPRLRGEQTKKRLVVPCILQYCFSFFNQFFVDMFC